MSYCPICGGSGVNPATGDPCECQRKVLSAYDSVACIAVPQQYQGIAFTKELVPSDVDKAYGEFLDNLYDEIRTGRLPDRNYLIAAPVSHGKTIFAYACIEEMFRRGYPVFPIFDVLELSNILTNYDLGRKAIYDVENPRDIVDVPLLFAKIPRVSKWEVFDAMALVLDRRVRRNGTTIFLFGGTYKDLVFNDRNRILEGLSGDGAYGTVKVRSYESHNKLPEMPTQGNIG